MRNATQVGKYLDQFRGDYLKLYRDVLKACEDVKEALGPQVVAGVYGRPETHFGPFKSVEKIALKLSQRAINEVSFTELGDIIGVTVVVQYPDQRKRIFDTLKQKLAKGVCIGKFEEHYNKNGYYGHHAICEKSFAGHSIKCEVQVKTMLHDAWSKKMHDLTYKPSGKLDSRLAALMQANAVTIENVEQQSVLIRDMILAGWDVEREARRAAQKSIADRMLRTARRKWAKEADDRFKKLARDVNGARRWIPTEPEDSPRRQQLLNRIGDAARTSGSARFAWILAGMLAGEKPDHELVKSTRMAVEPWLQMVGERLAKGLPEKEVTAIPLVFYAMGELGTSVEYADAILNDSRIKLSDAERSKIEFNRANALVEIEYHSPSKPGRERDALEQRILAALRSEHLEKIKDIRASIIDLEGFVDITFARDTRRVMAGIVKIGQAVPASGPDDRMVSEAYAHLNMRRGWRRFFEVEIEEQAERRAAV